MHLRRQHLASTVAVKAGDATIGHPKYDGVLMVGSCVYTAIEGEAPVLPAFPLMLRPAGALTELAAGHDNFFGDFALPVIWTLIKYALPAGGHRPPSACAGALRSC